MSQHRLGFTTESPCATLCRVSSVPPPPPVHTQPISHPPPPPPPRPHLQPSSSPPPTRRLHPLSTLGPTPSLDLVVGVLGVRGHAPLAHLSYGRPPCPVGHPRWPKWPSTPPDRPSPYHSHCSCDPLSPTWCRWCLPVFHTHSLAVPASECAQSTSPVSTVQSCVRMVRAVV